MKKGLLLLMILSMCFSTIACSAKNFNEQGNDKTDAQNISTSAASVETVTETKTQQVTELEPLPYESCKKLKGTIDMMVIYDFAYNNLPDTPDNQFWETFASSLLCNSWHDGFPSLADKFGTVWSNREVAYAGYLLTGKKMKCNSFPSGLDRSNCASPYAFDWKQKNISVKAIEAERWQVSFDFVWTSCSLDTKKGKKQVTAIIIPNEDSDMDGYSVESIDIKTISSPGF